MQRMFLVGLVAMTGLLGAAVPALGYVERPTIHEHAAEEDARQFLHKSYASWRYRAAGYVDCEGGRINRFTWACRAGWAKGRRCTLGRMQIQNEYLQQGSTHYLIHFRGRRC